MRKAFYAATLRGCADRCYIGFGTLVAHRESSIGSDVYIGPYCILGTVRVGDGVKIASRVSIPSGRHQHAMADGGASSDPTFEEVTVGAGAWIGEGAVVLASVGRGAVVGAGSVVVRAVPEGATVAGNPAREIASAARSERDPARALSS
jgi:acetyltransferase-like isoleucine patch superfamily enzyme